MIQIIPHKNPELTQFVFEQNIREDPVHCGGMHTVQCYLHWITQCNLVQSCCAEQWKKPLLRTNGCKDWLKHHIGVFSAVHTCSTAVHCCNAFVVKEERACLQQKCWVDAAAHPYWELFLGCKILTRCTSSLRSAFGNILKHDPVGMSCCKKLYSGVFTDILHV